MSRSCHTNLKTRAGEEGFTLIELLISVAVGAMIITALYATFFSVFTAGESEAKGGLGHNIEAGRVLDRFSREINSAYFDPALLCKPVLGRAHGARRGTHADHLHQPAKDRNGPGERPYGGSLLRRRRPRRPYHL